MNKCKCEKKIMNTSKRCSSCEMKRKWKEGILKSRSGKEVGNYKNGLWSTINKHFCIDCGKEICRGHLRCVSCNHKGKLNPNYDNHILSERYKGKGNPAYKHGEAYRRYTNEFGSSLKEKIRQRDNNICQICDKPAEEEKLQTGKKLPVHHIDYNKDNCKESNLITVCNSCHGKTNEHRKSWIKFFAELEKEL